MEDRELIRAALQARKSAYTPYSHFQVGAALLAGDGRIFTGCNIENAAYSVTNCAERTAFFKAVSEGVRDFRKIAIAGGAQGQEPSQICPPCGVCRQVMMEFCVPDEFKILLGRSEEDCQSFTLAQLLPLGFGPDDLSKDLSARDPGLTDPGPMDAGPTDMCAMDAFLGSGGKGEGRR